MSTFNYKVDDDGNNSNDNSNNSNNNNNDDNYEILQLQIIENFS